MTGSLKLRGTLKEEDFGVTKNYLAKSEVIFYILPSLGIRGLEVLCNSTQDQDLLEILDERFGQGSLILATQLPVAEWHVCIPNPTLAVALLDRPVHHAQLLHLKSESQLKLRAFRSMSHT